MTEYSSNYVWHDNAYSNKPERVYVTRGRIRNYSLFSRHKGSLQQLSQPQLQQQKLLDSVLYFPLNPSPRPLEDGARGETEIEKNGNPIKLSNSKKPAVRQKQRRSSSTRRYSLEADARGIKSHFVPASLDVFLDLGISSGKSNGEGESEKMSVDGEKCVSNRYFTSVYKSDFSCTK